MKYEFESRNRGQINVSLRLPTDYPWKVLKWLIDDLGHLLTDSEKDQATKICLEQDVDAYLELSKLWGLQSIASLGACVLYGECAKYQIASLLKKFPFDTSEDLRRSEALKKFMLFEQRCHDYNSLGFLELTCGQTEFGVEILTYARSFLKRLLGYHIPDESVLTLWSRHGPGASIGMRNGNTSLYFKYSEWPYTCTRDALGLAMRAIMRDERWYGALQDSYRERYNIPQQFPINLVSFASRVLSVVNSNRITFVPKDAKIMRSIAIEPTMNLWLQLGVDGYIRRRLKRWGVDLDDQTKNQEFARLGSISHDHEDGFVTLDLEGASDSVSLKLCEILLPEEWYSYLLSLRCPFGTVDENEFSYEKMSSMGNGFTFALESAMFTALIYAVYKSDRNILRPEDFCVFGDDIIVRRKYALRVVEALRLAGFTVNTDKTFLYGLVRESCGVDWVDGTLWRPVFLKTMPANAMELWNDVNRIQRVLMLRFGVAPRESKLVTLMDKWIPTHLRTFIGPYSDTDFDSCRHSYISTKYKNGVYKYSRLIVKPRGLVAQSFLFRKLMHDLRPTPPGDIFSGTSAGSRFTVTHRKMLTVGKSYSVTSYWCREYAEYRPVISTFVRRSGG
jgi:hypothetical protein